MARVFAYDGWSRTMKFTDDQVREILNDHEDGKSISELSYGLGVEYSTIYRIVTGQTYKHVKNGEPANHDDAIVEMVESGYSSTAIAMKLGISNQAVSKAYKRATGRSISEFRKRKIVKYGQKV